MWDAANWGYWGVFLLMVLENVIPPVPSEAIMSIGGIAVAKGEMNFIILIAVGVLDLAANLPFLRLYLGV